MIFEGEIKIDECKTVKKLHFEVPHGASKLTVSFEYSPTSLGPVQNHVNLLFYDSLGRFMGRYDRNTESFVVGLDATESAVRTKPLPGTWTVFFENHYLFSNVRYRLQIICEGEETFKTFKGEIHTHSRHSDGALSVNELSIFLKKKGFDFFFLTDHSNVSGWRDLERLDGAVGFPGQELNTFKGHALVLGGKSFVDWKDENGEEKSFHEIVREAHCQGALIGVAHPFAMGEPACVGCRWTHNFDPFGADFVEVWNADLTRLELNYESIGGWIRSIRNGGKAVAVAGRDLHRPDESNWMATYVVARGLEMSEVLWSMKFGRVYLSSMGELDVSVLDKKVGETVFHDGTVSLRIDGLSRVNLVVVTKKDAQSFDVSGGFEKKLQLDEKEDFLILLAFDDRARPLFLTNPIFLYKR
ncbi:CehA/McbA family metallohydrolase [Pseudothermotoga sp.]|nr:CehA/McbA family metallohydrolase [Pseudothermotoga sp.]MCX7813340.1 CehA/McbA family metallohydrolase [Pseudothermotoga sp.]MDW8139672.1 CehA/McbA family metallohydrolase [Pseudothermotoga sp.]